MNQLGLRFHHFGLAVKNKKSAINFLTAMGYVIGEEVYDKEQEVNLILCQCNEQPDVEVIYKSDKEGPINSILKNNEALIYHLCYITDNIADSVNKFRLKGLRVISVSEPKPAILFNDQYVAFYYIKGFGLIELLQIET
ncbi:MAG: methylmalonyl-CoA/ethylmalonyl-CoA epimerase [Alteromonadaceae bacterium]|jgi:methylmalonyl-CoA/ethylmalonyl-CoA epimerase